MLREDAVRMNTGDPEGMREALDALDEMLEGEPASVSLYDAGRDAAWADLAGG